MSLVMTTILKSPKLYGSGSSMTCQLAVGILRIVPRRLPKQMLFSSPFDYHPPRGTQQLLQNVANLLQEIGRDGQLVIIESTLLPGLTRRFAAWLDRPAIQVAHAPERMRIGDDDRALRETPRLVGGLDVATTKRAIDFMHEVGLKGYSVSAPEVSELSKLLENSFLTTNIALIGDFTRLAQLSGVSATEVATAAATKPHGFMSFSPGPGIGGHCLRQDVDLVRSYAKRLGAALPTLNGVANTAQRLPNLVVAKTLSSVCSPWPYTGE